MIEIANSEPYADEGSILFAEKVNSGNAEKDAIVFEAPEAVLPDTLIFGSELLSDPLEISLR